MSLGVCRYVSTSRNHVLTNLVVETSSHMSSEVLLTSCFKTCCWTAFAVGTQLLPKPTSLWEELRVNKLEGFFFHDSSGAFCFKASIQPFELGLREPGCST